MAKLIQYQKLALAARAGDSTALAEIYNSLGPPLLRFLNHLVQDPAAAEDLLHDSFLRLFQGRGRWRPGSELKPWLFTVARRLAIDYLRTRQRHGRLANEIDGKSIMGSMAPTDTNCVNDLVERTLATLPHSYRTTFHLRIKQEFTYPEIAAICGEPEGTLRSRVHHTMKLLRKGLELK